MPDTGVLDPGGHPSDDPAEGTQFIVPIIPGSAGRATPFVGIVPVVDGEEVPGVVVWYGTDPARMAPVVEAPGAAIAGVEPGVAPLPGVPAGPAA